MAVTTRVHESMRDARFLAALAVLLFNDLVLKSHAPGLVSGKLSDFAGMIVFPVVLAAGVRVSGSRIDPRLTVSLVAAWFLGLQLSSVVDGVHEAALGAMLPWNPSNTADPTDLVALLVLPLAHAIVARPRPLELSTRAVRLIVVFVAVGCLADSGPESQNVGPPVVRDDGQVELLVAGSGGVGQLVSRDGGESFRLTYSDRRAVDEILQDAPGIQQVCLPSDDSHCFRLGESVFRVEESKDGGSHWNSSWEITENRYLLRDTGNSFVMFDQRQRGIVALPDDTVIVSTVVGPTLRWTVRDGWTPTPLSLRLQVWPYLAIAAAVAVLAIAFPLLRAPIGLSIVATGLGLVCASLVGLLAMVDAFSVLAVGGLALASGAGFLITGVIGLVLRARRKTRLDDGRVAVIGLSLALVIGVVPYLVWTLWSTTPIEGVLVGVTVFGFAVSVLLAAVVQQHTRPVAPWVPPPPAPVPRQMPM